MDTAVVRLYTHPNWRVPELARSINGAYWTVTEKKEILLSWNSSWGMDDFTKWSGIYKKKVSWSLSGLRGHVSLNCSLNYRLENPYFDILSRKMNISVERSRHLFRVVFWLKINTRAIFARESDNKTKFRLENNTTRESYNRIFLSQKEFGLTQTFGVSIISRSTIFNTLRWT